MKTHIRSPYPLALFSLMFPLISGATIIPGFFEGHTHGAIQGRRHVDVFVEAPDPDSGEPAYGLILKHGEGSIYVIQELPDGTQEWKHVYQGEDHFLKVNDDQRATLRSVHFSDDSGKFRLIPADVTSPCAGDFEEIVVEPSQSRTWEDIPQTADIHHERRGRGEIENDHFSGRIKKGRRVLEGSFALERIDSSLGTLTPEVLDPRSISGWSQSRNLSAAIFMIQKHLWFGLFNPASVKVLDLPEGANMCWNEIVSLEIKSMVKAGKPL